MTPEKLTRLKAALVDLDGFLTEKPDMASRMMESQAAELQRELDGYNDYTYYLADGGLSRIVMKFFASFDIAAINPYLFVTSNSMDKVKERWKLEEAQDLVSEIVSLMYEVDQDMLHTFKLEVTDNAAEIDPSQEQDWYSLTLGWAVAKGLTPLNAISFAIHVRYSTDLA